MTRPKSKGKAKATDITVAVLVPRRPDAGHRDRLWNYCRARWAADHPTHTIVEGEHLDGPFNRSAAINRAAELAGDWDVAVILDSDVVIDPVSVAHGIAVAPDLDRLILPHRRYVAINQRYTDRILTGRASGDWHRLGTMVTWTSLSACLIVPRSTWDKVGGFDERFVGWGFEDNAFYDACAMTNRPSRLGATLFHLWHPLADASYAKTNKALYDREFPR